MWTLQACTMLMIINAISGAAIKLRYGLRWDSDYKSSGFLASKGYKILCSEAKDHHWANCQRFYELRMCKTHWFNMQTYCPKTCKFCFEDRQDAPARCESTKFGCCEDGKTIAIGPNRDGCPEKCFDSDDFDCPGHAKKGYCVTHYEAMRRRCPKSCNYCGKGKRENCMDYWQENTCKMLARFGTCKTWLHKMGKYCRKTCRICTAAAPDLKSIASDCSLSSEGCCWDRKTPLSRGCPACRDHYGTTFCNRFKPECHKIDRVNGIQIRIFCPKTCGLCNNNRCYDDVTMGVFCKEWKERGHCISDPFTMGVYCRKTCKFCK